MDEKRKTQIWLKAMNAGAKTGCHQWADRSLFVCGWQLPLCARCTGVVFGQILGTVLAAMNKRPVKTALAGCGIMLADWSVQKAGIRKSTNSRRLFTGIAGGFGLGLFYAILFRRLVGLFVDNKL